MAAAAAARHSPIAHISGGDVTLGAADEYYRHCIGQMAAVHFPSCADSAARLVRMGEAPDTVFCVGGLGDENIRTLPKMSREELCKSTGFDLMQPFALVTYHPETAPDAGSPAAQVQALCAAMAAVDGVFWLITGLWLCASQERENVLTGSMYVSRGPLPEGQPRAWFP